jgi:hypothetical protein
MGDGFPDDEGRWQFRVLFLPERKQERDLYHDLVRRAEEMERARCEQPRACESIRSSAERSCCVLECLRPEGRVCVFQQSTRGGLVGRREDDEVLHVPAEHFLSDGGGQVVAG